jgi:hypothetical protein
MNVESYSEGFKLKHGRYPARDEAVAFCYEFWFDPIFLKNTCLGQRADREVEAAGSF